MSILILPDDVITVALNFLPLKNFSACLSVSTYWHTLLSSCEFLWLRQFTYTTTHETKKNGYVYQKNLTYVPSSLQEMAKGSKHLEAMLAAEQAVLFKLRVKELKSIIRTERIKVKPGMLIEKKDFVSAIVHGRAIIPPQDSHVNKLLQKPTLLRRKFNELARSVPECYAKCALRLFFEDAQRTAITEDELCANLFELRTRNDGPLAQVNSLDPWYNNVTPLGTAQFYTNNTVAFTWPEGYNPFQAMGMPDNLTLQWKFEFGGRVGRIVRLSKFFSLTFPCKCNSFVSLYLYIIYKNGAQPKN